MKKTLFLSLLIVLFIVALIGCNNKGNERKVDYQLQKQCSEDSESFFKKNYNETFSGFYTNHYNQKFNKCFIVVNNSNLNWKSLYDVNESTLHGLYTPFGTCNVYEKKCNSEKEWDKLVKPYMEE